MIKKKPEHSSHKGLRKGSSMCPFCLHLFSITGRKLSPHSFVSESLLLFFCVTHRCDDEDRVCTGDLSSGDNKSPLLPGTQTRKLLFQCGAKTFILHPAFCVYLQKSIKQETKICFRETLINKLQMFGATRL